MATESKTAELPQGPIRYRESGPADGEPIVFVHGFLVDGRLWDGVAERLSETYRCVQPDWPMGSHRAPMKPGADLSPPGMAKIISGFLETLGLEDVTLVGNDSGGAMSQVTVTTHPDRIGRLVLTNCDSHDNFPPGVFKAFPPLARIPGVLRAMGLPTRFAAVRRRAYGPFARKPISDDLMASWTEPGLHDPAIRRDTKAFTVDMNKRYTLEAAEKLPGFDRPALLVWAPGDKYFPITYAERLAQALPDSRIVEVPDAGTFVSLDQPGAVADAITAFMGETGSAG